MDTLYKLTDENGYTYGGTLWGPNVTHSGTGKGGLCSSGWIHCYTSPYSAILLNPIHANFPSPRIWLAQGEIVKRDNGLKYGCKTLTTIREIPLQIITLKERVHFGILCAMLVYKNVSWHDWANGWINGSNRSEKSAGRAADAARAADYAAGAADAARAAAYAASAAYYAASAAGAAYYAAGAARAADYAADYAAGAADYAACAAAYAACAARAAAHYNKEIPIDKLAEKAFATNLIGQ